MTEGGDKHDLGRSSAGAGRLCWWLMVRPEQLRAASRFLGLAMNTIRRIWLWLRIIGREHWGDRRYGPLLAWQTACIIHPNN